jgi:hypothetical protein
MPLATVPVVIPLVIAATLRGSGRAVAAAAVTVTYLAVDLATVAVAAFGLDAGVLSLAWANAAGSAVAATVGCAILLRTGALRVAAGRGAEPSGAEPDVPRRRALAMGRDVGLPIVLSYGALFVFGMLVVRILRQFGPGVVSGFSIGYSLQTLAIVPAIALGSAGAIVINHLTGAGRGDEAGTPYAATLRLAVRIYAGVAVAVTGLAVVVPPLISSSATVADAGVTYLLVSGPSLLALGLILVTLTMLEQTGAARLALALNVGNVALVAAVGAALARHFGAPLGLYATSAVAALAGLPAVVALGRRHIGGLGGTARPPIPALVPTAIRLEPVTAGNRDAVHDLFAARDFLFKTTLPWLADPAEIDGLLTEDTRAITEGDAVLGLVELEPASVQAGHHRIHYRLRGDLAPERWSSVLDAVIAHNRDEHGVLRLTFLVHEFDDRGLELAWRCGLEDEGALPGTVQRQGRRTSTRFFARIYEPSGRATAVAEGARS